MEFTRDSTSATPPVDGVLNPDGIDPDTAEHAIYRDPYTGHQREIWKPGEFHITSQVMDIANTR